MKRGKKHVAGPSVQPHIQRARVEFERFIQERGLLPDKPELSIENGLVAVNLARPLTYQEMRDLVYLFAADPEAIRAGHEARESRARAAKGEEYAEAAERTKLGAFSVLSNTTKMGAYSFSLPAGPTGEDSLGTCPVSAVGWPEARYQRKVRVNDLADEATRGGHVDANGWVCASCYAMKGAYGSPSVVMIQSLRRRFVMSLAPDSHAFADVLTRSIRWGQVKSIRAYRSLSGKLDAAGQDRALTVKDPRFFRIHDAGDFGLGPWYVEAWLETVRRCSKPLRTRVPHRGLGEVDIALIEHGAATGEDMELPAVNFWASTRAWCVWSGLESFTKKGCGCIPDNLALRPSGLFFGDAAPHLNGKKLHLPVLDDSSKAITVGNYVAGTTADFLDNAPALGEHVCPAYTPVDPANPKSAPGACHKSRGANAAVDPTDLPAPVGHGCRACWLDKKKVVVYVRH